MQPSRIHSLDYLRGTMAFLIMIYHYVIWVADLLGSESFLGRVGVYGVAIFYILSGFTLYLVYYPTLKATMASCASFFLRRFFRIYPLLWLSMLLTILLSRHSYETEHLLLSFSGLFGFVAPTQYIGLVTWSIGNELVFYSIFPFLIILLRRKYGYFLLALFTLGATNLYFIFFGFDLSATGKLHWPTYVNPLNHILLFLIGVVLARIIERKEILLSKKCLWVIFLLSSGVLFLYPVKGDLVFIVGGWVRVLFILMSALICVSYYLLQLKPHKYIHLFFSNIGQTSYSIYLLHPVCFTALIELNRNYLDLKIRYIFILYLFFTWVMANVTYQFLEKPMMVLGKKLTRSLAN